MSKVTEQHVKAANRRLYDAVADRYEAIDARRSPALEAWLRAKLARLRPQAPGERLLDIGTGSGLVTRCAKGLFAWRVGMDLSPRILAAHPKAADHPVAADVDRLPFAARSFDVVTCFSVLHHLYTFDRWVAEVARVLGPGGLFYSDHDMDAAFARRFRAPLWLYRRLRRPESKYRGISGENGQGLYELAEWQQKGIDSACLVALLERSGFSVQCRFHWFGLSPITDRLFPGEFWARGCAPLLSLVATRF